MSGIAELRERLERVAANGHHDGLQAAAGAVRKALEAGLSAHRRSGRALDELTVTPNGDGIAVDGVRYMKFIEGVPKGDDLEQIAVDAYADEVRAQLGGGGP